MYLKVNTNDFFNFSDTISFCKYLLTAACVLHIITYIKLYKSEICCYPRRSYLFMIMMS